MDFHIASRGGSPDTTMSPSVRSTATSDVQQWRRNDFLAGGSQNVRWDTAQSGATGLPKIPGRLQTGDMFLSFLSF
jgi:hypothetical protein